MDIYDELISKQAVLAGLDDILDIAKVYTPWSYIKFIEYINNLPCVQLELDDGCNDVEGEDTEQSIS